MRPTDRRYTETHEWAMREGELIAVGITDFAVEQLGDLTYLKLPAVGTMLEPGGEFGEIESVKAVAMLYAPVAGKVEAVNEAAPDALDLVRQDPYGAGWMIRLRPEGEDGGFGKLLTAEAYEAKIAGS